MKLVSWNVNGVRAALRKGLADFVAAENPDILCLQETKAHPEQVELDGLDPAYRAYWNSAEKKGYSGTAVFTRHEPIAFSQGINSKKYDTEGRVVTLEYPDYFLVNVYTPNSQNELRRLEYRQLWDRAFLRYLRRLEKTKPVVLCGDLNVAHKEIDLARPGNNRNTAGFTDEERAGFDRLVKAGFIDTFREFEPGGGHYSWWSFRTNARANNVGWRIDYWLISRALRSRLAKAWILPGVTGSDHCPVAIELA